MLCLELEGGLKNKNRAHEKLPELGKTTNRDELKTSETNRNIKNILCRYGESRQENEQVYEESRAM